MAGLFVTVAVAGACVIAEPATDLPTLAPAPPTIVRTNVVPSPNLVLTRWPTRLSIPVRLTDPSAPFSYSWFVDYNPITREGLVSFDQSTLEIGQTPGATRLVEIEIAEPTGQPRCHVIEVVVALTLNDSDLHTPPPPGGDSVTWFYSPGGDLAGCPVLSPGLQPDAAALLSVEAGL